MKLITKITLAVALTASSVASAAVITGSLSYDSGTDIITDTATTTTYLGWDVLAELTYAQTLAEIASGATYDGYHIASQAEAYTFYHAARGSLTDVGTWFSFGTFDVVDGVPFGDNDGIDYDSAWFISDVVSADPSEFRVGLLGFEQGSPDVFGYVEDIISSTGSDLRSCDPLCGAFDPVSWLLVSNVASAELPEPSVLLLMGLGLLGIVGVNRRKIRA
jgi:hypothetical protein